jgi:hypothetical protein
MLSPESNRLKYSGKCEVAALDVFECSMRAQLNSFTLSCFFSGIIGKSLCFPIVCILQAVSAVEMTSSMSRCESLHWTELALVQTQPDNIESIAVCHKDARPYDKHDQRTLCQFRYSLTKGQMT